MGQKGSNHQKFIFILFNRQTKTHSKYNNKIEKQDSDLSLLFFSKINHVMQKKKVQIVRGHN